MTTVIDLKNVSKSYGAGEARFSALSNVSLGFSSGEMVGLVGPSGSGKSTLLNLVGGIDRPTAGEITLSGTPISAMKESALAVLRGRKIGIVFQFFQLIPTLSVLENVVLAMDLVGVVGKGERKKRAIELLDQVGIAAHKGKFPSQLSGGEQQRVAIARALANDPGILIADEPTGNLDTENSDMVSAILTDCAKAGRTVIVATHERSRFDTFDRVIELKDGILASDKRKPVKGFKR